MCLLDAQSSPIANKKELCSVVNVVESRSCVLERDWVVLMFLDSRVIRGKLVFHEMALAGRIDRVLCRWPLRFDEFPLVVL